MPTADLVAQRPEPVDAFGEPGEGFAPEELHVRLGRRHALGGLGRAAEAERRMCSAGRRPGAGRDRGAAHLEVLTGEGDVVLGPQPSYETHELLGARVPLGRIGAGVAVGGQVVEAADDVDQDPAAAELVQGRCRYRKLGRLPVAGANRDQGLEGGGPGGQRGGDGEGVGASPPGAQERAAPAVPFGGAGEVGGVLDGAPAVRRVVAAVARLDGVGDVPEEFRAHRASDRSVAEGGARGVPGGQHGRRPPERGSSRPSGEGHDVDPWLRGSTQRAGHADKVDAALLGEQQDLGHVIESPSRRSGCQCAPSEPGRHAESRAMVSAISATRSATSPAGTSTRS